MKVSQTEEYALRAAVYLATLPAGTRVPSAPLAEATSIPPHYVSKVMRKLVDRGICDSLRGHHGGFSLTKAPSEISFLDVLVAVDYDPEVNRCGFGFEQCDPAHPCPMHDAWVELKQQMLTWGESTTLADLNATLPSASEG